MAKQFPDPADLWPMGIRKELMPLVPPPLIAAYNCALDDAVLRSFTRNDVGPLNLFVENWRKVLAAYIKQYQEENGVEP